MWKPLQNVNQLKEGSKLRYVIDESNFQHESIYHVERIGELWFIVRIIEQNGKQLPEESRVIIPYPTQGITHYFLEIWAEKNSLQEEI